MNKNYVKIFALVAIFALSLFYAFSVVEAQPRPATQDELETVVGSLDPANLDQDVVVPDHDICGGYLTIGYEDAGERLTRPVCGNFLDHFDAERHYYHCQEGVAIMGAAINQLDPEFIPVLSTEDFSARAGNDCPGGEIYPDSGICAFHDSHLEAEIGHDACTLTNFQYWDYLSYLMNVPAASSYGESIGLVDLGWRGGNLWKPRSDANGNPITLNDPSYVSGSLGDRRDQREPNLPSFDTRIKSITYYDALGGIVDTGSFFHSGTKNGRRVHFGTNKRCSKFPANTSYIAELVDGSKEFRLIPDPCRRYE